MSDIPDAVKNTLEKLDGAIDDVEGRLDPLLGLTGDAKFDELSAIEKAQLHVGLGYTVNTLFYICLRLQGISPSDHPIKREIERIKTYMDKVNKLMPQSAGKDESVSDGRKITVNQDAAKRIVKSTIGRSPDISGSQNDDKATSKADSGGGGTGLSMKAKGKKRKSVELNASATAKEPKAKGQGDSGRDGGAGGETGKGKTKNKNRSKNRKKKKAKMAKSSSKE